MLFRHSKKSEKRQRENKNRERESPPLFFFLFTSIAQSVLWMCLRFSVSPLRRMNQEVIKRAKKQAKEACLNPSPNRLSVFLFSCFSLRQRLLCLFGVVLLLPSFDSILPLLLRSPHKLLILLLFQKTCSTSFPFGVNQRDLFFFFLLREREEREKGFSWPPKSKLYISV